MKPSAQMFLPQLQTLSGDDGGQQFSGGLSTTAAPAASCVCSEERNKTSCGTAGLENRPWTDRNVPSLDGSWSLDL